jgi:hypothetical protein
MSRFLVHLMRRGWMRVPDWGLLLKGGKGGAELEREREQGFEFGDEGWLWAIYIDAS